jgi:DMSO/TMAO reductase YedYZ molybdopterin-dependent catalytic subunit
MLRKSLLAAILAVGVLLAGCMARSVSSTPAAGRNGQTPAVAGTPTMMPSPSETLPPVLIPVPPTATSPKSPTATSIDIPVSCALTPVVAPTPAAYPGRNMLDESTGLHVTGAGITIDAASYRLLVTGLVDRPLSLSLDALRCLPKVTAATDLVCPGYFEDKASWSGVALKTVLDLAGLQSGAKRIILVGADKYQSQMDIQLALKEGNFLAYEWYDQPLPILHGFPLRAIFPSMQGAYWVKWLVEIKVE